MNRLEQGLLLARAVLGDLGCRAALVGGLAVSARAEPRFTRDIDVAVAVETDSEAEGVVRELMGRGWHVVAQVEQDRTGRLATVRFAPPESGGIVIDLLFASSGIEQEAVDDAEVLDVLEAVSFPVAQLPHLLAMKILASDERRPQDVADVASLLQVATPQDIALCRHLLDLVTQRGFHRDKDLHGELEILLGRFWNRVSPSSG